MASQSKSEENSSKDISQDKSIESETDLQQDDHPLSKVMTKGGIPERDADSADRGEFQSPVQYIMTCIAFAVGLGNVWRFPALAYEHGGSAFLIPYITCAFIFGLPILYMELTVGQFTQSGASVAFRHYFPLLQGLGWASGMMAISIALYYVVIIGWTMVYLYFILTGQSYKLAHCDNVWNTEFCHSEQETDACIEKYNDNSYHYWNGTCTNVSLSDLYYPHNLSSVGAAEEFFESHILNKQNSFGLDLYTWDNLNIKMVIALALAWSLSALGLLKGVKVLGRLSLFTATVPYIIIGILFARGVTLEGAYDGIRFYLLEPKFEKIAQLDTWRAAIAQASFSLSIGVSGMLSMSSHNKRSHPCYRDALIIIVADSFMSIFGGVAVFSTLGYISFKTNVPIDKVVQSGVNLAFVAYPTAISSMPVPWLWAFCFFFMLFILGISTNLGFMEAFLLCILDQFPILHNRRALVTMLVALVGFIITIAVFCFPSGIHWFQVLNEFIGSFSLSIVIFLEIVCINLCYGPCRYYRDLQAMFGHAQSCFKKVFGASGYYIRFTQFVTGPILALIVLVATFDPPHLSYGKDQRTFEYPDWVHTIGWAIGFIPVMSVPLFMILNPIIFLRKGQKLAEVISVQPEHPAIRYNLPKRIPNEDMR